MSGNLKNFTRIWNPILEALAKAKLTQNQYKICLALFQSTYTWHKTEARLSYRDMERCTGIRANKVGQPFKKLISLGIIVEIEEPSFNAPGLYRFNKDIREWSEKVLDISQISNTNIQIVTKECSQPLPNKGGSPQNGDSPQDRGEGTPQNGGEGTPQNGHTSQPSRPYSTGGTGSLKKGLKKYKEKKERDLVTNTLVATREIEKPPDKKPGPKDFLKLENYDKVEYLKTQPRNKQVGLCVIAYNHKFPNQAERFGTGGTVTARKVFEQAVKNNHTLPEKILVEILYDQGEDDSEPTPWELVDCLKDKRGLESTWAYVMYDMERYDREVGIKTYGPVDTQRAPPQQ